MIRRRLAALSVAITLLTVPIAAQYQTLSFEQITIDNTSGGKGFTAAKIWPSGQPQADTATCTLRTAEISYTVDGTAPTTTVGQLWEPGESKQLNGFQVLSNFRAIRTGSTSGGLDCVYARR